MTISKIFLCFCLSFTGGIFISSFFAPPLFMLGAGLILAILLISVFWQYKKLVVIGFCILFLIAGVWRHQIAELKVFNNELRKHNDSGETITLVGTIVSEPDIREKSQKLTLDNLAIVGEGDPPTIISGRVLVTTSRYPEYQYGDKLKITGKLETPQEFEDFNYKGYLAKDGIYSVIYRSKIELLERGKYTGPTRATYAKILDFKNKLRESIYQNLSPPQSSIL